MQHMIFYLIAAAIGIALAICVVAVPYIEDERSRRRRKIEEAERDRQAAEGVSAARRALRASTDTHTRFCECLACEARHELQARGTSEV
jgi:hypothetical protein